MDAFLIDEIGKMECHCPQFISNDEEGGSTEPIPLVRQSLFGAVDSLLRSRIRPDVQIVEVTQANRQTLPGQIAAWVKQRKGQANTPERT